MKCQKCNKNEANVQYRETINGETREICLCSRCAEETGLLERTGSMFRDMEKEMMSAFTLPFGGSVFNRPSLFGRAFFEPAFGALPDARDFFGEAPEKVKEAPSEETAETGKSKEDELKAKLLDAIAEERYEDAAKLRDEIKKLK